MLEVVGRGQDDRLGGGATPLQSVLSVPGRPALAAQAHSIEVPSTKLISGANR